MVFPDYADTILLTGASASINQIMTNGQQQKPMASSTHAAITNGGSYSGTADDLRLPALAAAVLPLLRC